MNLLFLFHRGNLLPPFLLFLCLRSWNSPGNRTNKARQIVPSLVNPAEALSFSQFVSLIEELGSGNQVTAASVNGVFTVTGRSVNLQDCSCSRIVPPHILKNRRVSRRDTRLVSRSLLLYIYIHILFLLFLSIFFAPLPISPLPFVLAARGPNFYRDVVDRFTNDRIIIPLFTSRILPRRFARKFFEFTGRQTTDSNVRNTVRYTGRRKERKSVIKKKEPLVQSVE